MKIATRTFYIVVIASSLLGFCGGAFIFGMVVHENSHAIACLLLRVRIHSYSIYQVVYETSSDPRVNVLIGVSGGIGQALFSFFFFWYVTTWEKRIFMEIFSKKLMGFKKTEKLGVLLGFEISFFALFLHGIVNAIWEGFFYSNYLEFHDNLALIAIILFFCLLVSFLVSRKRYLQLTSSKS